MTAFLVALAASTWLLAPARHHLRAAPRPRAGTVPLCTAEPTRLMLVDDQDGLRNAVRSYLVHNGFKCDAFSGVAAAFDAISKGLLPDLIITDVLMPELVKLSMNTSDLQAAIAATAALMEDGDYADDDEQEYTRTQRCCEEESLAVRGG